uniref:Branched-chain-amino-acid aminotransferase n=1 Tax=Fervidicoccus fontis TaxID=683846 RepID=A0A7J3ZKF4_9CREN
MGFKRGFTNSSTRDRTLGELHVRWGEKIWFDGELIPFSEAKVHVMMHTLHYGVGVFEGMRAYRLDDGTPGIFRLEEHLKRFAFSARAYKLELPYTLEELKKAVIETVRASGFGDCYIRPIAFINLTQIGLYPSERRLSVAIGVLEWGKYLGKAYERGARVATVRWRRPPPDVLPANAKAIGNYLNSYLATLEARERGFDEALMLDHRGFVSEGPGENVFLVKNGRALTPPVHASILPGITRGTVMVLLREKLGLSVEERDITLGMLYDADELFFVGTAVEVTPIVEVDGITIGNGQPGSITRRLQKLYEDAVRGRVEEYRGWITRVE